MLKIDKFHVQLNKSILQPENRKYLRISVNNLVKMTSNPAKILNETSMEWDETIIFPMLIKKQLAFEIYEKHVFGYNPEEIRNVLCGSIIINSPEETHSSWEITSEKNQIVGYLSADIKCKLPKSVLDVQQVPESDNETKLLTIKSIVAHLPLLKNKKGFLRIQVGSRSIDTLTLRSRSGELVFIDSYEIQKQPQAMQAKITVFSSGIEDKVIGEGNFMLVGSRPKKKMFVTSDGIEVGEMFIDSKLIRKLDVKDSRISRYNEVQSSFAIDGYDQPSNSPKNIHRRRDLSSKSNKDEVKSHMDRSHISERPRKKQISVMTKNDDIVFSKEQRFMVYKDRQNQNVTYLGNRSFEFRNPLSKKYYKGAGMGFGFKTDFTKEAKENPGVGNYQLPSIWDRY